MNSKKMGMRMKRIFVNAEACTGCGLCQLLCSVHKTGQWHPALARIKIKEMPELELNVPVLCLHCSNPPCEVYCVMNLIYKDPNTGYTLRREDKCIGCRACEIACPFSAAVMDPIREVVVNCDLCEGDPLCVSGCPEGALLYMEDSEAGERKRKAAVSLGAWRASRPRDGRGSL